MKANATDSTQTTMESSSAWGERSGSAYAPCARPPGRIADRPFEDAVRRTLSDKPTSSALVAGLKQGVERAAQLKAADKPE
jgi:hypothetical protein